MTCMLPAANSSSRSGDRLVSSPFTMEGSARKAAIYAHFQAAVENPEKFPQLNQLIEKNRNPDYSRTPSTDETLNRIQYEMLRMEDALYHLHCRAEYVEMLGKRRLDVLEQHVKVMAQALLKLAEDGKKTDDDKKKVTHWI